MSLPVVTKTGRIQRVGRTGLEFIELHLDDGQKVMLKHDLYSEVWSSYMPQEELYFVERRLKGRWYSFVQWVGTRAEAIAALNGGRLEPSEVPAPRHGETSWSELAQRGIYALLDAIRQGNSADVGLWYGRVNGVAHRAPFPELSERLQFFLQPNMSDSDWTRAAKSLIEWMGQRQEADRAEAAKTS